MAEEKKDAPGGVKKDDKKTSGSKISWEEVLLLLLGITALFFVFIPKFSSQEKSQEKKSISTQNSTQSANLKQIYNKVFFEQDEVFRDEQGRVVQVGKKPSVIEEGKNRFIDFINILSTIYFSFFIFLSLLFGIIIYYNKFKTDLIIKNYKNKFTPEDKKLDEKNEAVFQKSEPDNNGIINPKWQLVGKYYNSANQSDWKLAIIEADIMLYEVLDKSGFPGNSIGEMLKSTDKSKLATLDNAWTAHKVRNEVAHQGSDYVLSRSLVEETIANYEKVFEELNFI